jgi:hypothetical protein
VQELNGATPVANLLTGLGIDEILLRTDSAGARSFLTEGLGSTMALADSTGALQTREIGDVVEFAGLTLGRHTCGKNTRQTTKYQGFTTDERKSWG